MSEKSPLAKAMEDQFTPKQRELIAAHGTPAEFAKACYEAVPGYVSMDEAGAAVAKYNREFAEAGQQA